MNTRASLRRVAVAVASALGLPLTHAATSSWDNLTDVWSTPTAWTPDGVPVSSADALLNFGGTGAAGYISTNDLAGAFLLNGLTLASDATVGEVINASAGGTLSFVALGETNPVLLQNGSGAFDLQLGVDAASPLSLGGTGAGVVTLSGPVTGAGGLTFQEGNWRFTNIANSFTGGVNLLTGSMLELAPAGAGAQPVNITPAPSSILGGNSAANPIVFNGGTLKLTTNEGGSVVLGGGRALAFGLDGGVLDIRNSNGANAAAQGGNISGGDLNVTVNSAAATPAVIKFNGGQLGLSSNNVTDGNWNPGGNGLRFSGFSGTGNLRIELTNGAMMRGGIGAGGTQSIGVSTTWRGVVGGDPTSGPSGTVVSGLSRTTGRVGMDNASEFNYTSLRLEGALQIGLVGASRAINGGLVIGGSAGGAAGYVVFNGRGTNGQLNSTVGAPGAATAPSQFPLWLLRNGNGSLTIEDGGIAVFDARVRSDTSGRNGNGVALDGPAFIQGGGKLVVMQSVTNFTPGVASTIANAADIIIYGDITGSGSTARESVLEIALPEPQADGSIVTGIPATLTATATTDGSRPYGGLRFDDSRGTADFIINGTGFGGLRVNGVARPSAQISGGTPDPVGADLKVASVLTAARLSRIKGTGGYLTPAPTERTFQFPAGGEWGSLVPVGLRVANQNSTGVDVSLAAVAGFQHSLVVDAGATLDLGAASPFIIDNNSTLHGKGTVISSGSVVVGLGSRISPGLDDVGTLAVQTGTLTLAGGLTIDVQPTTADLLAVSGDFSIGGALTLSGTFGTNDLTIATYTGVLNGIFGSVTGLSPDFTVDYGTGISSTIRLLYTAAPVRTWDGTPGSTWSVGGGNWKGGAIYADGNKVIFDGTASGSTSVSVSGSDVQPGLVTVNADTKNYTITSSVGAAVAGSGQLVKNGGMTLTLVGPATYSGGTVINAGILALGSANALPDLGAVIVEASAVLNTQGNSDTLAELTVRGSVSGGGTLTLGALNMGGGGTISTNVALTGGVLVTGASPSTVSGQVDLTGGTRTVTVDDGSAATVTGVISNGGLTKAGPGILNLAPLAPNAFAGGLQVIGGTLTATPGAILADTTISVSPGAVLDWTPGGDVSIASLNSSGTVNYIGSPAIALGELSGTGGSLNGTAGITLVQNSTSTYNGAITGPISVTMLGAGSITLGGASSYSGGLFVESGRVVLTNAAAGGSGNIVLNPAGKLGSGAALTSRVLLQGGTFFGLANAASAASGEVVAAPGVTTTVSLNDPDNGAVRSDVNILGTLRGSGDLNVVIGTNVPHPDGGAGFRLRGAAVSDYSGKIFLGQSTKGEIQSGQAGPFSPAGTGTFVMSGGTFTGGLNGNYSQLNIRNNFAGNTIFGNDIEVTGSGFVNLNMAGSAAVDAVTRMGVLRVGAQTVGVNKNGTPTQVLEFTSVVLTGGDPTFAPTTAGFGASGQSNLRLGAISELNPGTGIILDGTTTLTLAGAGSYTGATRVQNGTLRMGAAGALPAASRLIVNGGTVDLGGPVESFDQTVGGLEGLGGLITNTDPSNVRTLRVDQQLDGTFSGSLSGNIVLTKTGPANLIIAGSLNPGGPTVIEAGTLSVNGSIPTPITVQDIGTLGGIGIVGAVDVVQGGRIAPGNGPGILNVGELSFDGTAALSVELGKLTPGAPPQLGEYDALSVTGGIALGGPFLDITVGTGLEQGDIFTIILNDGADGIFGVFDGLDNGMLFSAGGQAFQISYFDDPLTPNVLELAGGNDVSLLVVPEPGSVCLLLGGLGAMALRRRRTRE